MYIYSSIHLLHQWLAALASEVLGQCGSFMFTGVVVHFVFSGQSLCIDLIDLHLSHPF